MVELEPVEPVEPVIPLPAGILWHGTQAELVDLMAAVFHTCKDHTSHPEGSPLNGSMCGHAVHVCEVCKMLNDQQALNNLLWARRTRHQSREWDEVEHPNGWLPPDPPDPDSGPDPVLVS